MQSITMRQTKLPTRDLIRPETPLRLSVAAALAFPDESMTASGFVENAREVALLSSVSRVKTILRWLTLNG